MTITLDMDKGITTAVVDPGLGKPISVWIDQPIDDVKKILKDGGFVDGDSGLGRIHFAKDSVKALFEGKRQFTIPASDRASGAYI